MNKTVLILAGAPGTGKSHFADFITALYPSSIVCSADEYMMEGDVYVFDPSKLSNAHQACFNKFQKSMEDGENVIIISNTNCNHRDRRRYIDAVKLGYDVISLALEDLGFKNTHNVPDDKVCQMAKTLGRNFSF